MNLTFMMDPKGLRCLFRASLHFLHLLLGSMAAGFGDTDLAARNVLAFYADASIDMSL